LYITLGSFSKDSVDQEGDERGERYLPTGYIFKDHDPSALLNAVCISFKNLSAFLKPITR
jgi:hypothetical protein